MNGTPLAKETPVQLAAWEDAPTDTCVFLPKQVLPEVRLPARLIIAGSIGSQLVGAKRVDGPNDESVIRVSRTLLDAISLDREGGHVAAQLSPASRRMVWAVIGRGLKLRIIAAIVLAFAALAVAVASIITLPLAWWIVVAVLVLAFAAASITAWREVRDTITPRCG
jgi:hypothetical protein